MTLFEPEEDPESRRAKADYETVPDRKWKGAGGGCTSGCAPWVIGVLATVVAMAGIVS